MIRCRGVTLIELMVTISIAAVFLAIAIPSFLVFLQNSSRDSQVLDFVTSLNFARSEAIKRGYRIKVCSSSTGTSCAGSTTWDTGWLAFADTDGDTVLDAGETILGVHSALAGGVTLRSTVTRVTYENTGYNRDNVDVTFRLCDARGLADAGTHARQIVISAMGRVTVTPNPASCP